jgi:ATP-dependent exoDNAse (exonuclease V) alpha subunit
MSLPSTTPAAGGWLKPARSTSTVRSRGSPQATRWSNWHPTTGGGLVNGQHGLVVDTDPQGARIDVVWDDGRRVTLADDALDQHHLAYGSCTTIHKAQGQTVDHAILFADGGGRELAYVGMSRARHDTQVVVVADNVDQAVEQLRDNWQSERRERWVIDTEQTLADALDRLEQATAANLAEALDDSTLDPLHRAMRSLARSQDDELTLER